MGQGATTDETTQATFAGGSSGGARSRERQALFEAIEIREQAERETQAIMRARERAKADRIKVLGEIADLREVLEAARTKERELLTVAFVEGRGDPGGDDEVAEIGASLARAERRLADIRRIEVELAANERQPGYSIPSGKVEAAVREVVKAAPVTRRLVEDYRTARAAFLQYEATLMHLALGKIIPDDLRDIAPRGDGVRYAEPDPEWLAALAELKRDADAPLPG